LARELLGTPTWPVAVGQTENQGPHAGRDEMKPHRFNWLQLLRQVRDHANQLEELEVQYDHGEISLDAVCADLVGRGFSMAEVSELRTVVFAS